MSWKARYVEKASKATIRVRVLEDDVPKDLTDYTAKYAVKADLRDTTTKIGPVSGVISAHDDDTGSTKSVITFTLTPTLTNIAPFDGVESMAIYDSGGNKMPLTPPGGVEFHLTEDILDVTP